MKFLARLENSPSEYKLTKYIDGIEYSVVS